MPTLPSKICHYTRAIHLILGACLALFAAGAIAPAAAGAKKIGAKQLMPYKLKQAVIPVDSGDRAGTYVSCPKGGRIVAGGTFFTPPAAGPDATDNVRVTGDSPVHDGKRWYGAGYNLSGEARNLYVRALCLPKKGRGKKIGANRLMPYKLKQAVIPVAHDGRAGPYVSCPRGGRIVAGGTFFTPPSAGPDSADNVYVTGDSPTHDGKGWYGAGYNFSGEARDLYVRALCLPKKGRGKKIGANRLKPYKLKQAVIPVAHGGRAGTYVSCPKGGRIVAGGTFHAPPAVGPDATHNVYVSGNSAVHDGKSWYGSGNNFSGGALDLYVRALCLPK